MIKQAPTSKLLILAVGGVVLVLAIPVSLIVLRQRAAPKLRMNLNGHMADVSTVAFTPDGKALAGGGSSSHRVKLWDLSGLD